MDCAGEGFDAKSPLVQRMTFFCQVLVQCFDGRFGLTSARQPYRSALYGASGQALVKPNEEGRVRRTSP